MKKTLMILAIAALAAGTAFAQRGDGRGPMRDGSGPGDCDMTGPGPMAGKALRGDRERPGGPMSAEMKDQMRAEHRAIRDLGQAARAETDEAKKAELVAQLRAKLGEVADRMQAHQEERLAQAEERLADLKARIADGQANRDSRIEEQIQRILAGERPPRPAAFDRFPHAKGAQRGPGFGPGGGMPPPPPPEDMPEDLLPPPEE